MEKLINWKEYGFLIAGVASNGREAFELHSKEPFDLIITDLKMPVMGGIELIKAIHDSEYPCQIMIVSAYGEFEFAREAMKYGVNYYLLKPIDEEIIEGYLSQIKDKLDDQEKPLQEIANMELVQRQYAISKNGVITEMKRYINVHYAEQLTLNLLAYKYSFNASYLGRLFKKEIGMSFNDYLRVTRISEACDLMETTDLSVNEIAEKCGYNDPYYFSKQFRETAQLSPSEYRAEHGRVIKEDNWVDKDLYNSFQQVSNPYYMVTFTINVTELKRFCVRKGISFYLSLIYCCMKSLNSIENFRYVMRNERIYVLDKRRPVFTSIQKEDGIFHITSVDLLPDLESFVKDAQEKSSVQEPFLDPEALADDVIYFSGIPGLRMTALTNEKNLSHTEVAKTNITSLCWEKINETSEKTEVEISIEANRRFVDSWHISAFTERLEKEIMVFSTEED